MKVILDIKGNPKAGDLLVFDGSQWRVTTKENLFLEQNKKNEELEQNIVQFKADVNQKLKDFHEVLQLLSKKEE